MEIATATCPECGGRATRTTSSMPYVLWVIREALWWRGQKYHSTIMCPECQQVSNGYEPTS